MLDKLLGHLARLGGMIVRPRATLLRMFQGSEGSLMELVPWMVLLTLTVAPVDAGRALLVMRSDPLAGLQALLRLVAGRLVEPLACAFAGGAVLYGISRVRRPLGKELPFDQAIDLAGFMLVPYLALAAAGVILEIAGLDLWWMPHHQLNIPFEYQALKALVSYGWSFAILIVVSVSLYRAGRVGGSSEEPRPKASSIR